MDSEKSAPYISRSKQRLEVEIVIIATSPNTARFYLFLVVFHARAFVLAEIFIYPLIIAIRLFELFFEKDRIFVRRSSIFNL